MSNVSTQPKPPSRISHLFFILVLLTVAINSLFILYIFLGEESKQDVSIENFPNLNDNTETSTKITTLSYYQYDESLAYYYKNMQKWTQYDPLLKKFTNNGAYVKCSSKVNNTAQTLSDQNSFYNTIQNINEYIGKNVGELENINDISCLTLYDADQILEMRNGCCLSRSILFCSMARCLGIPCKVNIGVLSSKYFSTNQTHAWAEIAVFYEDHNEWRFVDPNLRFGTSIEPFLQYGKIRELTD